MTQLKFEAGKKYVDRKNNKNIFIGINPLEKRPDRIAIFANEDGAIIYRRVNGRIYDHPYNEDSGDIIAEYREPRVIERWLNVYDNRRQTAWAYNSLKAAKEKVDFDHLTVMLHITYNPETDEATAEVVK